MSVNLNSKKMFFLSGLFFFCLCFFSCKNFFNGEEFLMGLEQSVEYENEPYADITISSLKNATESILPSAGFYNDKYKKNDSFNLEFVPTSSYQFVKWTATPSGAIEFENEQSLSTTAKIVNTDESIKIEPLVYERATITILPGNAVENPRNSTIVISPSFPLNLTQKALNLISITVDGISVKEKYSISKMDDNSKIIFEPKRNDYIDVPEGSSKTVVVTIPKEIHYEKDGVKVYLEDDFIYSFKINSSTETSAQITISCPASQGDISFSGSKTFYLDDEMSITVTPNQAYILNGWNVKYDDGTNTDVEDNILFTEVSEDKKTIKIKLLTGATKKISITPDIEIRGFVNIRFSAAHGSISPSEDKKYYVGESFNVTYRESGSYSFTSFAAKVSNGETPGDYISLEKISEYEIKCTVLKGLTGNDYITLYASDEERPAFAGFFPDKLTDVNRDTCVKVFFTQSMSDSSIYWTEDELKNLLGDDLYKNYDLLLSELKTAETREKYYYAYQEKGNPDTLQYKNIEIKDRSKKTDNNLLKYFGEPCFENDDNETLIILSRSEDGLALPSNTNVDVKISGNFTNKNLIKIDTNLQKLFITSKNMDENSPVFIVDALSITGMEKNKEDANVSLTLNYTNEEKHEIVAYSCIGNIKNYIFDNIQSVSEYKSLPSVTIDKNPNHKIEIKVTGTIKDEESKPDFVKVSLIPIKSDLKNQYPVEYSKKSDALVYNKIGQAKIDETFEFNLKPEGVYEGAYKIFISAFDKMGYERVLDKTYAFVYDDGNAPVFNKDDIVYPEGTFNERGLNFFNLLPDDINNKTEYLNFLFITEESYSSNLGPIFKLNLHNCEYCVYADNVDPEWISSEEEYDLTKIYKNDWWKLTSSSDIKYKKVKVAVRDIYGKTAYQENPKEFLYIIYADYPTLLTKDNGTPDIEIMNNSTYGSMINFTVHERCSPLDLIDVNVQEDNKYVINTIKCNDRLLTIGSDYIGDTLENKKLGDENGMYRFSIGLKYLDVFRMKKHFKLSIQLGDTKNLQNSYEFNIYPYKVNYYRQKIDKQGYDLESSEMNCVINADSAEPYTNVEPPAVKGFKALKVDQQIIKEDGSTEINIYYDRIQKEIKYRDEFDRTFTGTFDVEHPNTNIFGETTVLPEPKKSDYIFEGWYLTSDCTGKPVTSIDENTVQNITGDDIVIYAKWTLGYKITYNNLSSVLQLIEDNTQTYTIRFTDSSLQNINYISDKIETCKKYVILDFSNTEITQSDSMKFQSLYIIGVIIGNTSTIETGAFRCPNLQKLVLSQYVKTIKRNSISGCRKLESIIIPKSVTSIENMAISDCDNLSQIIFEDTNNWYSSQSGKTDPIDVSNPTTNAIEIATNKGSLNLHNKNLVKQ